MRHRAEFEYLRFRFTKLQFFEWSVYRKKWDDSDTTNMFNASNHSSERSFRRDRSQRVPSTHRSKSNRSMSTPSRHSDTTLPIPQIAIPVWVHCEKCFDSHNTNPNMLLLSCGHILCRKCLRVDNCCKCFKQKC